MGHIAARYGSRVVAGRLPATFGRTRTSVTDPEDGARRARGVHLVAAIAAIVVAGAISAATATTSVCRPDGEACANSYTGPGPNEACCSGTCDTIVPNTMGTCRPASLAAASECKPAGASCAGSETGPAADGRCCTSCCLTLLPSLAGVCIPADACSLAGKEPEEDDDSSGPPSPPDEGDDPGPPPIPPPPPAVGPRGAADTCDPASADFPVVTECGHVTSSIRLGGDLHTERDYPCLVADADHITIDGCGFEITAPSLAVQVAGHHHVTIQNVRSPAGIQIYGDYTSDVVVRRSELGGQGEFGGIRAFAADDVTIDSSITSRLTVEGLAGGSGPHCPDPQCVPERAVITNNEISGPERVLFRISGGRDSCPRGDHLVLDNYVLGTARPDDNHHQLPFYYRCTSHSTIARNHFRTLGFSKGLYFRDAADHNLVEDNYVHVAETDRGALAIESGNLDKTHPADNVFRHNVFRTDVGSAGFIQAYCARRNRFEHNVFWNDQDFPSNGYPTTLVVRAPDNVFDHNTIHRGGDGMAVYFENRDFADPDGPYGCEAPPNRFDNNIVSQASGDVLMGLLRTDRYVGDFNVFFNASGPVTFSRGGEPLSIDDWREHTGGDTSSIIGDPRFLDPHNGDFRLGEDSAAQNADQDGRDAGAWR